MDALRQLGGSLLLAAFSIALVVGGLSLALAESYVPVVSTPTGTQAPVSILASPSSTFPVLISVTGTLPSTSTASVTPTTTTTFTPPVSCPPPSGWIAVLVQPGESLATLASRYQTTTQQLSAANCLFSPDLPTGSILYVPPVSTQTPVPCGPPAGWIRYSVQPGNTLFSLSQAYGVSVSQLQSANCMPASQTQLNVGQTLWVPNVATRTPRATATRTLTPVVIIFPTLTASATPQPTVTNAPTSTSLPTNTATASPSATPTLPTATPTSSATITAFPSATPLTPNPSQ